MEKRTECIVVGGLAANCWLYQYTDKPDRSPLTGEEKWPCAVIDPGEEAQLIFSRLNELHWIPHYIFLTHGHYDHLSALPDLLESCRSLCKAHYGEDSAITVKTGIHRLDSHYLGTNSPEEHRVDFAATGGDPAHVDALWKPLPEADMVFDDGDRAGPFTVLHLPGHSPGSVGYYDEEAGVIFTGDTLFNKGYGRTDLPGGSWDQIRKSIQKLFTMKTDTKAYPGHGPKTFIKANKWNFL